MVVLSRTVALAFKLAVVAVHGLRRLADEDQLNATGAAQEHSAGNASANLSRAAVAPADVVNVAPGSGVVYSPAIPIVKEGPISWTYFPEDPRLGIATGGLPGEYGPDGYGTRTALILKEYAKKKGYALYVDKNLGRHVDRHVQWAKVHVMRQLVDTVPFLVWIDPDVVLTRLDFSLEVLIKRSTCRGDMQYRWDTEFLPEQVQNDTFLWLSADQRNGGFDQYEVNCAPGVVVLRRGPYTQEFLEKVWKIGSMPGYFLKHRAAAHPREGQVGEWPFEMGAIWDVLAINADKYMRRTCIAPLGYLHSFNSANTKASSLLRRLADKRDREKVRITTAYFRQMGLGYNLL